MTPKDWLRLFDPCPLCDRRLTVECFIHGAWCEACDGDFCRECAIEGLAGELEDHCRENPDLYEELPGGKWRLRNPS